MITLLTRFTFPLVSLGAKLALGMLLLGFPRNRYRSMKEREREVVDAKGKGSGGLVWWM
jgi:hypothetical protein